MQGPHQRPESGQNADEETYSQLEEIEKVLDELKQRRITLEKQRKQLLRSGGSVSKSRNTSFLYAPSQEPAEAPGKAASRSQSQPAKAPSAYDALQQNVSALSHSLYIPSEAERRQVMKPNVFGEMKESIRRGWQRDSTLRMGTFLLEDNPRTSTFGRERRFVPIVGQKGQYHLSTDTALLSKTKNMQSIHLTASSRGKHGANLSNHWNDMQCRGPPGPGAYTPRYSKQSKPVVRTRL